MNDPKARAQFEDDAAGLQNAKIIGGSITHNTLTLQIDGGYPDGRFAIQINAVSIPEPGGGLFSTDAVLEVDFDEPAGAGADPFGRPDPRTNPEAWTE